MAIDFETSTPNKLLNTFVKAIEDGHVQTWARDRDGDFYHTASSGQWSKSGYLRPKVVEGTSLRMTYLAHPAHTTTWADLGVLQGRFVESMMTHCHDIFARAVISAEPTAGDKLR